MYIGEGGVRGQQCESQGLSCPGARGTDVVRHHDQLELQTAAGLSTIECFFGGVRSRKHKCVVKPATARHTANS